MASEDKFDFDLEKLEKENAKRLLDIHIRKFGTVAFIISLLNFAITAVSSFVGNDSLTGMAIGTGFILYALLIPLSSLLLALPVGAFPQKNLNYGQRYFKSFLWVIILINAAIFFLLVWILIDNLT